MSVDINYWAVLLAGLSSLVVGSVWYSQATFAPYWMKLIGKKMDRQPRPSEMARLIGSSFVASLVTAYVLAHMAYLAHWLFGDSFVQDSLVTALWLWLGFTALRLYVHDAFESRPWQLTLLNSAHELVTVLVMALIIGLLSTPHMSTAAINLMGL